MSKKLTGAVLLVEGGGNDADLLYHSGFTAPDPVVLLCWKGRKILVVSILEAGRARHVATVDEVLIPAELGLKGAAVGKLEEWAKALLRRERVSLVHVKETFPFGIAEELRRSGVQIEGVPDEFKWARRIKSEYEQKCIRQTQRAAVAAMRAAMQCIAMAEIGPGNILRYEGKRLTSERVRARIETVLLERNCVAPETIVAGGAQGAEPHARGSGVLRAGQFIVLDIFPRHKQTGYWGDITRTVYRGELDPVRRRMWGAVRAAQRAALETVRAGVMVRRVHQQAQRILQEHGFETTVRNGWGEGFIHSTGHGVGLAIHEPPSVNMSDVRLRTGDVITIEPGLYYKRYGGVRIEDTVVVTATGHHRLAQCPYI